jgi:hypothetical protein
MRTIHLKESEKNAGAWDDLTQLAATERRTLAGMVWTLVLEGMERRESDRKVWEALANPDKATLVKAGTIFKPTGVTQQVVK